MQDAATPPFSLGRGATLWSAARAVRNGLAGAALGFFVGVMISLATQSSPILSSVLTSTMALVTAYGAFRMAPAVAGAEGSPPAQPSQERGDTPVWTVIGFGLFATAGVLTGIYLRAHQTLSPTPLEEVQRWTAAGFTEEQSRCLAAVGFGYSFRGAEGSEGHDTGPSVFRACTTPSISVPSQAATLPRQTVLLNKESSVCRELGGVNFATLRDAEEMLVSRGAPWSDLYAEAVAAGTTDEEKLAKITDGIHEHCARHHEGDPK